MVNKNVDEIKEYQAQNLDLNIFEYVLSHYQVLIRIVEIILVAS